MLENTTVPIKNILEEAVRENASDVHFIVGRPPTMRLHGRLIPLDYPVLTPEENNSLAKSLLEAPAYERLTRDLKEIDGAFSLPQLGRFRINVYKQKGFVSIALRILNPKPLPLDALGLPSVLSSLTVKHTGMVLVTGPTGSGKSTTLAALIDQINRNQNKHIITIEDPIEYVHLPQQSIVTQREIGKDTTSFAGALRSSLRQDPDVILLGEMRDLETIQTALTAAETGHLVFSTLHTNSAVETVHRIVDVFPTHQQAQIRLQLAANIQAILSQQLLPRSDQPGRAVATELLIPTGAIRHLIREGKTHQIQSAITTGKKQNMHTMDMSLRDLYQAHKIDQDTLYDYAIDPENMAHLLNLGPR